MSEANGGVHSVGGGGFLTDKSIGSFLAARRKLIAGLLGVAGMLSSGQALGMTTTQLAIQAAFGFMALYGIHEVANDQPGTVA